MSASLPSENPEQQDCFLKQLVREASQPLVAPRPKHAAAVRAAIAERTRPAAMRRLRRGSWTRAAYGVAAGLLAVLAALLVVSLVWPSSGWAQIAEAMRAQPWIHAVGKSPDGKQQEFWLSLPREIVASRSAELIRLEDFRLRVRYEYQPEGHELIRVPAHDDNDFASIAEPFVALLRGEKGLGSRFAEDEIVEQRRETVRAQGRTWHDYVMMLRRGDHTVESTIRVNPERNLPVWWTLKHGNENLRFEFDYPAEGPADIYALGVPRQTKLIDRVPPRELSSILADIKQQHTSLDHYFVIFAHEGGGYFFPERLGWRQGDRWRVELCCFPKDYTLPKLPPDAKNGTAFWRAELKKLSTLPLLVCDGKTVWRWQCPDLNRPCEGTWKGHHTRHGRAAAQSFGDSGRVFIDSLAYPYPGLVPSSRATLDLVPDASGGPPGALLIHRTFLPPSDDVNVYRQVRFWIDPAKRYATVQTEFFDNPAVERDPASSAVKQHDVMVFEQFQQSPQGIWYPTILRRRAGGASRIADQAPKDVEVRRYWLDFAPEMPDSLFKPEWRK